MVCQQSVWGADWHRATVSQSLVHGPSLPQLRPLLCWLVRHDKGKGRAFPDILATILSCCFTVHYFIVLSSCLFRNSLTSGLCWWGSKHHTLALWLRMEGWILSFSFSTITTIFCYTWIQLLTFSNLFFNLLVGSNILQGDWLYLAWKRRHQSHTVSVTFRLQCWFDFILKSYPLKIKEQWATLPIPVWD